MSAYENYLVDVVVDDTSLSESKTWNKLADALIRQFSLEAYNDRQRLLVVTLLVGVRSPDTDGHAILDLDSSRILHTSPDGQAEHALRSIDDDGPEGDRKAVEALRKHIKDELVRSLDTFRSGQLVTKANVYLDFYGVFETEVLAAGYHLGRAMHALQDSFSHALRSDDFHRIRHVMNYAEAMGGHHDEHRDGLAHSVSMDQCTLETAPLVRAATEATISLLIAYNKTLQRFSETGFVDLSAFESFLDDWVSYDETPAGCTLRNNYCGSYWVNIARDEQTEPMLGCALSPGVRLGSTDGERHGSQTAWGWLLVGVGLACRRVRFRGGGACRRCLLAYASLVVMAMVPACKQQAPLQDVPLDCTAPQEPCGGDPVGVWSVTDVCGEPLDASMILPGCDGVTMVPDGGMVGTLALEAERTAKVDVTFRRRSRYTIPASCLELADTCMSDVTVQRCRDLAALFRTGCAGNEKFTESLLAQEVVCATQDEECSCSVTQVTPTLNVEGSYAVEGTRLTLDSNGTREYDFCVQDRLLTLRSRNGLKLPFGTVTRSIRLLRQR